MDTIEIERPSLVDKLLRRRSRSSETTEKSQKTIDEVAAGVKSEIEKLTRLCNRSVCVNGGKNGGDEKPKESIESLKTEAVPGENVKVEEKPKNSESKEKLVINNEVGRVKLTDIINNSIKEAVLSIVKAGVCPVVENSETPAREARKSPPEIAVEEARNVENKSKTNKNSLSSLIPKTFDSHLCRNEFQASSHFEPLPVAQAPRKVSRETNTQEMSSRDTNSRETNSRESKEKKAKSWNPKDGKSRDPSCTKIVRPAANKRSHFRTDNRRMTGNVNIYICSEANEKSNDLKLKSEDEGPSNEELETDSQTKSNESNLSISTSKLVAALKRRQLKNASDESPDFISEAGVSPVVSTHFSRSSIEARIEANEDDEISDNVDENDDLASTTDPSTPLSRDDSFDENSIEARYADREFRSHKNYNADRTRDNFASHEERKPVDLAENYNPNHFEPRTRDNFASHEKKKPVDLDENCFCCSTKRCLSENPSEPDRERRENRPGVFREFSDNRCLCVIEEKEEDRCVDKKVAGEEFTVCFSDPAKNVEISQEDEKPLESKFSKSASGSLNPEKVSQQNSQKRVSELVNEEKSSKGSKDLVGKSAEKLPEGKRVDEATKKTSDVVEDGSPNLVRKVLPVPEVKSPETSFFRRTTERAMAMIKNMKTENANEPGDKKPELVPEGESKPKENGSEEITAAEESETSAMAKSLSGSPSIPRSNSNENRSKSRISVALAKRKHLAMKNSSPKNVPSEEEGKTKDQFPSKKSEEMLEGRSKRASSWNDCKCIETETREPESTSSRCNKSKPRADSNRNENNGARERIGSTDELETKDAKTCKCCPGCRRSLIECKCRLGHPPEQNFDDENPGQPAGVCVKNQARRDSNGNGQNGPKSMICIYCDNPRENCSCNAPIGKCSRCGLPLDVCTCESSPCAECNGRQIFPAEDKEQRISVTAWKPRREIARYFSRSPASLDHENCSCWQNSKPYGMGELPYQKTIAFSDVMDELQQKISGSMYCKVCKKIDCRCRNDRAKSPRKIVPGLSTIPEHEDRETPRRRSRTQSPPEKTCKCEPARRRNPKKSGPMKICDRCQTSPCLCRRARESPGSETSDEFCYCKSSPCTCESVNEQAGKSRPKRAGESPNGRRKDRPRGEKVNGKIVNEDNEYSAPEKKGFVPRPGKPQRNRKYSYRASSNATRQKPSHPDERVR